MFEGRKDDSQKIRMELIPPSLLQGIGSVLTFGAKKYADRNWERGIKWSRGYGALLRHMTAWWSGENSDPETGYSHLWHAGCCLAFLIEYERTHPELDDRPGKETPHDRALQLARRRTYTRDSTNSCDRGSGLADATGEPYLPETL